MIGALSAFIREFNQKVEDLSLKETPSRLAAYLAQQVGRAGSLSFDLETSKTELASKLGTVSETLSRNLRKLRELGVIEVSGRRITIRDYDRLELIAAGEKV
jgi:CRP/FNR family transcriptional regulator